MSMIYFLVFGKKASLPENLLTMQQKFFNTAPAKTLRLCPSGEHLTNFTSLKEVQHNSLDAGSSSKLWLPFMYLALSFPLPAPRSKLFSNKKCPVITKLTLNKNIS